MSVRSAIAWTGRMLWKNATLFAYLGTGVLLARMEPGYNHIFAAYLLVSLVLFDVKFWLGEFSVLNLVAVAANLSLCLWMALTGNADVVPYLGVVLFGCLAVVAGLLTAFGRPLTFRDASRTAENYLDTVLRGLVAAACAVLSLAWMPAPVYILGPILIFLGFKLTYPLRRLAYPVLLRLAGVEPTAGVLRVAGTAARRTPVRAVVLTASALAAAIALPLLLTPKRCDVTIPEPYTLPVELLEQRRAELETYVAAEPGSLDTVALTELGLVFHNLGLFEEDYLHRAAGVLDRALFLDPGNAQALAWHGSNEVAFAIYEWRPAARMRHIARGLDELQRAVGMAPDDPVVRLARLDVSLGVPSFVGLLPRAEQDVEYLLELVRSRPGEIDDLVPLVQLRAGDLYARLGRVDEARGHWRAALDSLPPDSPAYRRLAARLAGRPTPERPLVAQVEDGHDRS